ncbi:hypothetical protein BJY16_005513 [Actinoplanes octamycinicus]|uniref:Uncharacterized protein n=1 Tax=Actinoplanes octamycinicus TaxID=135948 RepID=A0A7W7M9J3_9ACTN|nr:hypothetical protein [Actinoplanes octamycinicus]MBB4742054.1 hypothetical protein [Actinoplanes octamycinicus]
MRVRRTHPIDLDQTERWATGEQPGPDHQGLADLLAAAKAPATPGELAGRQAAMAAFTAVRDGAQASGEGHRVRTSRTRRALVVNLAAGVVLVAAGGTAVAARSGVLPDAAQERAHELFSGLGVPAPQTSSSAPSPVPSSKPSRTTSVPSPAPATSPTAVVPAGWCRAWAAAPRASNAPWRRKLVEAAGSEAAIPAYCAALGTTTTSPAASPATPSTSAPGKSGHSRKPQGKPSSLPTPSHPGKK